MTAETPYDRVRYPSAPFWEAHPDRLRLVAHLFGFEAAPAERCRLLEVGCGAGGHLVPMAATLPESRFLGIDLAASAIAEGTTVARALGLPNLELRALDLTALPEGEGAFDYIVAHGVYSWIQPPAQRALLDLFARHLAPGGVGYLSHLVLPGAADRLLAGQMMRWRTAGGDARGQVPRARALLGFLASAAPLAGWGERLRAQHALVEGQPEWQVRHDALGEHTSACWFHELAAALEERGLSYLGDCDVGSMLPRRLDEETRGVLERLAADQLELEQLLDCVGHRAFRLTLVSRRGATLDRSIGPERARALHVHADAVEGPEGRFRTGAGAEVTVGSAPARLALRALLEEAPASLSFPALAARAGVDGAGADALAAALLELVVEGFLGAALTPARCARRAGERPRAPAPARLLAPTGTVTNLHHRAVRVDPGEAALLALLDGTRDRTALRAELPGAASLDETLDRLARRALLLM